MVLIFLLNHYQPKLSKQIVFKRAFTLIELMISIAIIGIITVIAIASVGLISQRGRDARRIDDMKSWQNAQEVYFSQDEVYYAATDCTDFDASIMSGGVIDPKNTGDYQYDCQASADLVQYCASARLDSDKNANCGGCACDATSCAISPLGADPYFCVSSLQ